MEPYFLDKLLKYNSRITEDFYLYVQPLSPEYKTLVVEGTMTMLPCNVRFKLNYNVILCSLYYTLDIGKV